MKIFFWQNMASHIQSPALRDLADIWPDEVWGIWSREISQARKSMGWEHPNHGKLLERTLPDNHEPMATEIVEANKDAIHIFSGLHSYPRIEFARKLLHESNCQSVGRMLEPGISMGWRGALRPLRTRWIAGYERKQSKLLLTMGQAGAEYYQGAGFSPDAIFPFIYQSDVSEALGEPREPENIVRFVYVGKFIPRKGVDLMLKGFARSGVTNWTLDIIGTGPEQAELEGLASSLGISDKVSWLGKLPNSKIPSALKTYDMCVIPSRFEGWGVVVNEAIQCGVGILCSDGVTSRELVTNSGAGIVYPAKSATELANSLALVTSKREMVSKFRKKAIEFAPRISSSTVAEYLRDVFRYVFAKEGSRPTAPWSHNT